MARFLISLTRSGRSRIDSLSRLPLGRMTNKATTRASHATEMAPTRAIRMSCHMCVILLIATLTAEDAYPEVVRPARIYDAALVSFGLRGGNLATTANAQSR